MALPGSPFDAVNVTSKVPAWPADGVQVNVPDVFDPFAVKVAPVGRFAAVSEVIASPFTSAAVTVNETSVPSVPDTVGGDRKSVASGKPGAPSGSRVIALTDG